MDEHSGEPQQVQAADPLIGTLAFNLSLDAIVVMNARGDITGWNPAAEMLFGWTAAEAVGKQVRDLIVPDHYRTQHDAGLKRFRETGEGPVLGKVLDILTARRRDGVEFPVELRISHASGSPAEAKFVAFLRDISQRKWAERHQQTRYAVTRAIASRSSWMEVVDLVLESAAEQLGFPCAEVWLVDEETLKLRWERSWTQPGFDSRPFVASGMETPLGDGDGVLVRSWKDRIGVRGDLQGEPEPRRRAAAACGLGRVLASPILGGDTVLGVVSLYGPGLEVPVDAVAIEVLADIGFQLGQHLERVRVEEALRTAQQHLRLELEQRASTDSLTGLMNRAGFEQALTEAVTLGRRKADQFSLLMLDLNDFKTVNDTRGHITGDLLLKGVAARLKEIVRDIDMVARLGGDEFAVLTAAGVDINGARRVAAKILEAFAQPIALDGGPIAVTPSIGIALFPAHGMDAAQLLRCSDAAMYLAKRTQSGQAIYREGIPAGRGGSRPLDPAEHQPQA